MRHDLNTNSTSTAKSELLNHLTAKLGDISLEQEALPTSPTSPITPVPSLTNSRHSRSSSAISEGSPYRALASTNDCYEMFLPHDPDSLMAHPKRTYEANVGSGVRSINPPLPNTLLYQDNQLCWTPPPNNLPNRSKILTLQAFPDSDVGATTDHWPRSFEGEKEVSYIDWDDEGGRRRYQSPLRRIKKSFTDLRAAERFISEAKVRNRIYLPRHQDTTEHMTNAQRHEVCEANHVFAPHQQARPSPSSTPMLMEEEKTLPRPSAKLRKKPSTKFSCQTPSKMTSRTKTFKQKIGKGSESTKSECALLAPARDTGIPPTPPSTGKRKRANTTTSERSREAQTKKLRLGVVGKLVTRLLGAKEER
ncbi:hypothetical protein AYO22_03579 [Fonsecaea multimorphosa]|nr:hypothetical protein AYO22_03579 [Fonsecaea multimorphosa]